MKNSTWYKTDIQESLYLGWRWLGPLFGTRYYLGLSARDGLIKVITNSPFFGLNLRVFSASAVLCVEAHRSSLFYTIMGATGTFISNLSSEIAELMVSIVLSVIVGVVIKRLYERPYINFFLEGGERITVFTNFNNKLPGLIRAIELARGNDTSESMRSSRFFYIYQARALPNYSNLMFKKLKKTLKLRKIAMLLVLLVGVLAAIAIPAFQDYTLKVIVIEGFSVASSVKIDVAEYAMKNGSLPNSNAELGMQNVLKSDHVQSILITDGGKITITLQNSRGLSGKSFYMIPSITPDGFIRWTCRSETIPSKYLPRPCRG